MHELAHAIGVTHPSDAKQIMNSTANFTLIDWGAGDLNGLRTVGLRGKVDDPKRVANVRPDACA